MQEDNIRKTLENSGKSVRRRRKENTAGGGGKKVW